MGHILLKMWDQGHFIDVYAVGHGQISVVKMVETPKGLFKRQGVEMECMVERGDSYEHVAEKASQVLGMSEEAGLTVRLFRVRGALIPNNDVEVGGEIVKWSLGSYLRSLRLSAEEMKIDLGLVCSDSVRGKKRW